MKLYAISDLHLANKATREALPDLPAFPDDDLIVAGDVGESEAHLRFALEILRRRFRRLYWVPGNHDLWTSREDPGLYGDAKYMRLVETCRDYGVLTPEDPFGEWTGEDGESFLVAPLFTLYDYSFCPPEVPVAEAVEWAAASGILCSDEVALKPDPYPSRPAWCAARVRYSEERLARAARTGKRLVLVNHWPLRHDLVDLPRIPRFSIWCGTTATEDWHQRFRAAVVVHGHLHIRMTHFRGGVRFEEVSLGYPRDWNVSRGIASYLRQILPGPSTWMASG